MSLKAHSERADVAKKEEIYKRIRVVSLVSVLPLMMCAGPLGGYWLGKFLARYISWPYTMAVCVALGAIGSGFEVYRIIRIVNKIND